MKTFLLAAASGQPLTTLLTIAAVLLIVLLVILIVLATKQFPKAQTASAPVQETVDAAPTPTVTNSSANDDSAQLVAIITAAICAARSEAGNTQGFRVVSFKRANKSRKKI